MSTSLATVAADFFSHLAQYLNGDDFILLMKTGNRLLRHKLRLKCFSLRFDQVTSSPFPFEALRLPNLRSLSIHGIKEAVTYLDLRAAGELAHSLGNKTLQKLKLDYGNACSLFLSSERSEPGLALRDRFPSLSTLILNNLVSPERPENMFDELPEGLTNLEVTTTYNEGSPHYMYLSKMDRLPRHLTSLHLAGFDLSVPDIEVPELFLPNLLHLNLSELDDHAFLNHLPPQLKTLGISSLCASPFVWKASKIPKNLVSLRIDLFDWELELDVPLPSTLESLDIPRDCKSISHLKIEDMPLALKKVNPELISWMRQISLELPLDTLLKRFPNTEHVELDVQLDLNCLPAGLETLHILEPQPVILPLPIALLELQICFPLPSKYFENLPTTLRALWAYNEDPNHIFPPWNESDMAELTSKLRLQSLDVEATLLERCSCLAPLSKMESLKEFRIEAIGLDEALKSPEWLPKCLPRQLESLQLRYSDEDELLEDEDEICPDNFLLLCDLSSVTPHLRSLEIESELAYRVEFGGLFATLPPGILFFGLDWHFADLHPEAISSLPRSLRRLCLKLHKQSKSGSITNKHFEGMPESIQELKFEFGSNVSYDSKIVEMLPNSIIRLFSKDSTRLLGTHPLP